ncbi:MAG: DUF1501 domain-containing protein [Pirellulales bacterium]
MDDARAAICRQSFGVVWLLLAALAFSVVGESAAMADDVAPAQHGQSGMWVSDALPHLSQCVDDIALIRSLYTTNITHEPAPYLIQTGHNFGDRFTRLIAGTGVDVGNVRNWPREPTDSYGRHCLIARRLIERGVRFVQLYIKGQIWDNHAGLATCIKEACDRTDLSIAGLLRDLKQRGLLGETLIMWGSLTGGELWHGNRGR